MEETEKTLKNMKRHQINAERSKTEPNQIKAAKLPSIEDPQGSSIEDPHLRIPN